KIAGIALVMQSAEPRQPFVAIEAEPVADGALAHAEEVGDLVLTLAFVTPQQGGQAHAQAVVGGLLTAAVGRAALRGSQPDGDGQLSPCCPRRLVLFPGPFCVLPMHGRARSRAGKFGPPRTMSPDS